MRVVSIFSSNSQLKTKQNYLPKCQNIPLNKKLQWFALYDSKWLTGASWNVAAAKKWSESLETLKSSQQFCSCSDFANTRCSAGVHKTLIQALNSLFTWWLAVILFDILTEFFCLHTVRLGQHYGYILKTDCDLWTIFANCWQVTQQSQLNTAQFSWLNLFQVKI